MSSLRSALEEMTSEELRFLSDEELEADVLELQHASDAVLAEQARRLAEVERRRSVERDGFLSVTAWLRARARISASEAKRRVRVARALRDMPSVRRALSEGAISAGAAEVLIAGREACPEEFERVQETFADVARHLDVAELRALVGHWQQAVDEASGQRDERLHERRRLHVSPTLQGCVRMDGDLDPDGGAVVLTAISAAVDASVRACRDARTPAQRRADAIVEICQAYLASRERPKVAGERPNVMVVVDLEVLEGRSGRAEIEGVGPISSEAARQWACDADVTRVITRGRSEPLDVGRTTPVVPAAMRKAVVLRDRRCRFPGCDRRAAWCDAHHIVPWPQGETALRNLVLLCRGHHRMVHRSGFGIAWLDGGPVFTRPDGTVLEDRAPP